jgi:hypothetical protein
MVMKTIAVTDDPSLIGNRCQLHRARGTGPGDGTLTITSLSGAGTVLRATLPLSAPAGDRPPTVR